MGREFYDSKRDKQEVRRVKLNYYLTLQGNSLKAAVHMYSINTLNCILDLLGLLSSECNSSCEDSLVY